MNNTPIWAINNRNPLWYIERVLVWDTGFRELLGIPHSQWTYESEALQCSNCDEPLFHQHCKSCLKCYERRQTEGLCASCSHPTT